MFRQLLRMSAAWTRAVARLVLTASLASAPLAAQAGIASAVCPGTTGHDYSGQNLTNQNFSTAPAGSLKGANFNNAILKGAIFSGQNLSGASFQNADLGPSELGSVDFTDTTLNGTCFSGAVMNATDFTYANFHCTDFSDTSLIQAQFGPTQNIAHDTGCRTTFVRSVIDYHAISPEHWGYVDFTNASFRNPSGFPFSLAGQDITNAKLAGTDFTNIDFHGANLTDVDFTGAVLAHATLDNTALNGAKLKGAQLHDATLNCAQFNGYALSGCNVPITTELNTAADLTQANLQRATLHKAMLDKVAMPGANLSAIDAAHASFRSSGLEANSSVAYPANLQGANLSNADFRNAHLNFVPFNNAILTGADFDGETLNGTDFSNSVMPNASFVQAVLENVKFDGAILQNATFQNATIQSVKKGDGTVVSFSCSQLGGSTFENAKVTAANFLAAVMPPAGDCCPQPGNKTFCGTVNITAQTYGGVTYPKLQATVTCPNGDVDNCNDTQWRIPDWQTQLCNAGHATETVWTKPDCNSQTGPLVKFNDPHLKACILATLQGNPQSISVAVAKTLLQVSCPNMGISDLTGLENFTGLTTLDLTGNQLKQFKEAMPMLETLKLSDNQLASIDLTQICTADSCNLAIIDLSHNQLQSIVGMGNISPVVLDVSYNQFTKFDLPILDALVFADLSHNQLTSVLDQYNPSLSRLGSLSYLDMSYNSIPTIGNASSIAQTGKLTSLYLACNDQFNCESLNLTGSSPALQNSQCAKFDPNHNQWVVQPHPSCPTSFKKAAVSPPTQ